MSSLNPDDLQRIFTNLDKNGDGLISIDELKWLLENIGFKTTVDELRPLVGQSTSLDSIDFFLFYDIILRKNCTSSSSIISSSSRETETTSELAEAFKVFDLNGDGFICCDELEKILWRFGLWDERQGRPDCRRMIDKYDMNSDGLLDFEEFKKMMIRVSCTY